MQTQPTASGTWDSQLLAALTALKNGDFSVRLPTTGQGGTADQIAETYNATVTQCDVLMIHITRIANEVGRLGMFGGQIGLEGLSGRWAAVRDEVNEMEGWLTARIRNATGVLNNLANGEPTEPMTVDAKLEMLTLKNTVNRLVERFGKIQEQAEIV